MRILRGDHRAWEPLGEETAVTIGVYDGVHRGHQQVLRSLRATGLPVAVATFRDHPVHVIAPGAAPPLLTTVEQRLDLLAGYGVAVTALLEFNEEFRQLSAERFVEEVVVDVLRARRVAVGSGFRFGHRQLGDVDLLRNLGERHGFVVEDVDILEEGVPVRSTVVRALLREGHAVAARRLLGRPFRLEGTVVRGDQRGRRMGFPTANLEVSDRLLIPGSGVYAVRIGWDGLTHSGVVNVGNRPTFGGAESVVEAHVLDFSGDLYGKTIAVDFIERLRSEQKFDGIEALVAAIGNDVVRARQVLEVS